MAAKPKYQRILLKLSGEALMGSGDYGIDPEVIGRMADEILEARKFGVEIGVVIGGGNIFRGAGLAEAGMDRVTGDHMGMLATVMNALAMQDAVEKRGGFARVMSAIQIHDVCEDFIRRRAARDRSECRPVAEGDQGRWRVQRRPQEEEGRATFRARQLRGSDRAQPEGDGHRRDRAVPRPRPAAAHLRHDTPRQSDAHPQGRIDRHPGRRRGLVDPALLDLLSSTRKSAKAVTRSSRIPTNATEPGCYAPIACPGNSGRAGS